MQGPEGREEGVNKDKAVAIAVNALKYESQCFIAANGYVVIMASF